MSLQDFQYSFEQKHTVTRFVCPTRIVCEKNVLHSQQLLEDAPRQACLVNNHICHIKEGGYVVVDFGSELQGGADLTVGDIYVGGVKNGGYGKVRLTFGESVTEAMSTVHGDNGATNDHSTRDMTVHTCFMSTMRYGNTGFRFLKIEPVECALEIVSLKAAFEYRNIPYLGSFRCSDPRLNRVYDTAAYTVHLCMQDYIWDGIKRDRLVWVGDMHPEVSSILCLFGQNDSVEKTLDFMRNAYPISETGEPVWMIFPSYSCWWLIIHRDYYMHNANTAYLLEQKDYFYKLIRQLLNGVDSRGNLHFGENYFIDWSSNNTPYMEAGFRGCLKLAMDAAAQMAGFYGDDALAQECLDTAERIPQPCPWEGNKQAAAMAGLAGTVDAQLVSQVIRENLLQGLSTFYGYYVLKFLAGNGHMQDALEIVRKYWGGMLDLGATTFWEDFDINWLENAGRIDEIVPQDKVDVHADYGKFCYQKLRHSLCHGWASGPCPFLTEFVLGVQVLEPGCKTLKIQPQLEDLQWAEGTYPTPYGLVSIRHECTDGQIRSHITAPEEIKIICTTQEV